MAPLWPMAAMCPDPLSAGDRAYLEKYKRVIDYAHHCRGMMVWPGEAPNNIARDDAGMEIEKRRYFDVEIKLLSRTVERRDAPAETP